MVVFFNFASSALYMYLLFMVLEIEDEYLYGTYFTSFVSAK